MDSITAALEQYERENGFPSELAETQFLEALRLFTARRKNFHLANPHVMDLDVLSFEEGQFLTFIREYPSDPLNAADNLWRAVCKEAQKLAEDDAADADYDTIMGDEPIIRECKPIIRKCKPIIGMWR